MDRTRARALAKQYVAEGRPTDWFDVLYSEAQNGSATVPWADFRANPNFVAWLDANHISGTGKRALKVGCGYGDDVEELLRHGFDATGCDISPTAIATCRTRFPSSNGTYVVADVLEPPAEWRGAFDFVLESYTLQVLPPEERRRAISQIASFIAPGGTLLVIARGRNADEDPGQMPWPIVRDELQQLEAAGLKIAAFEDYVDDESPPVRRFRATYRR